MYFVLFKVISNDYQHCNGRRVRYRVFRGFSLWRETNNSVLFWFSYAIDWEPSHRRIRVMLGKSGKIVCILKVDPLYSSGQGHVHLLGVEGGSYHKEIQHLQVQWYLNLIEHLLDSLHQEAFVNAPRNKREARLTGGKCGSWGVPKTKKAREVSVAIPLYLTRLL